MNKIWVVKGRNVKYSDDEIIKMISCGELKGDDYIATLEINKWVKIADSIYQYYLKEN